jgi:cardiolipin synthase
MSGVKNHNMIKLNIRFFKRLPAHELRITISTLFTMLRILLTPIIVAAMLWHAWGTAFVLFMIAAVSDVIDGYLARALQEKTFLGACLDPIADKFLVLACFFSLAFIQSPLFSIPLWFVLLVLTKELILLAGTILIFAIKGHIKIMPRLLGKLTTFVQMVFIIWLFACYFFKWVPIKTYYTMLGILLLMVFASLIEYTRIGLRMLR